MQGPIRNVESVHGGLQVKALRAAAFWTWIDLHRPGWTRMSLLNFHRGLLPLLLLAVLGGCVTTDGVPSVVGGECKVFTGPQYAVRGSRPYDQDWIDSTVEGGVGACKWARPAPRPAALDTPHAPRPAAAPKKRPSLVKRIKAKVWPTATVAPIAPAPEPPAPVAPPAPRSAIDELLNPSDAK